MRSDYGRSDDCTASTVLLLVSAVLLLLCGRSSSSRSRVNCVHNKIWRIPPRDRVAFSHGQSPTWRNCGGTLEQRDFDVVLDYIRQSVTSVTVI